VRRLPAGVGVAFALVASHAHAQSKASSPGTIGVGDWELAPLVEIRTRGEYRRDAPELAGVDVPGNDAARARNAYGVLERSRLGLGAAYGTNETDRGVLGAQLTLQDARAWGVPSPSGILGAEDGGASSLGLYEAWIEARTSAARPSFLRVGRQAITWGDGRLVSNADWSPVARTLDAARGHASVGMFDFEAFAAVLDSPHPLGAGLGDTLGPTTTGDQLYGAQAAAAFDPLLKAELSLLARVTRDDAPTDASRFALARADGERYVGSLRIFGGASGWKYAAEGAYELGRAELLAGAKIAAYAGAGYVEKKLGDVVLTPAFRLEADYASGGGNGATYKQFDPLLPDVHALHGAMDEFAWSNTMQLSARASIVPWTDGRAAVEYRYVQLASMSGEWLDGYLGEIARGRGGGVLGHEVDAWVSWRPWPVLDLVAGYSVFALGDAARAMLSAVENESVVAGGTVTPASLAHFAYLQATLRVP
jgi:hypothetical protein